MTAPFAEIPAWLPGVSPLVLLSVFLVGLIAERFRAFRRLRPPAAVLAAFQKLRDGEVPVGDRGRAVCLTHPGLYADLYRDAVAMAGRPAERVAEELSARARREFLRVKAGTSWLEYAAHLGPLAGLLFCLIGVVSAFGATGDGAKASAVAAAIATALVPTIVAVGLAAVAHTFAQLFRWRLRMAAAALDETLTRVPERVAALKPDPDPAPAPPPIPTVASGPVSPEPPAVRPAPAKPRRAPAKPRAGKARSFTTPHLNGTAKHRPGGLT